MSRSLSILDKEYFDWMCNLIFNKKRSKRLSYQKLLSYLHNREFIYTIEMDGNRAEDGTDLRYRFAYDRHRGDSIVAEYLDDGPCSILEMMVALALRCEEHIMDNYDIGNRTDKWFWTMIESLGLIDMTDDIFDERYVEMVIDRFLNRDYKENGEGGLFTVERCRYDMRTLEIWYQMCWYLNDI